MRNYILLGFVCLSCCVTLRADDGDDTLVYQLAKADLVIAADLGRKPAGHVFEAGVVHFICELRNAEVLAGTPEPTAASASQPAATQPSSAGVLPERVDVVRFTGMGTDTRNDLNAGARLILFLERAAPGGIPVWRTSDMWLGAQPYSDALARSIRRLATPEPKATDPLAEVKFWPALAATVGPVPPPPPPVPTETLRGSAYGELVNPEVLHAFWKLRFNQPVAEARAGIASLAQHRAIASLQLAPCHPRSEIRLAALKALADTPLRTTPYDFDKPLRIRVVPFLLLCAQHARVGMADYDPPRDEFWAELARAVSHMTGFAPPPGSNVGTELVRTLNAWQDWPWPGENPAPRPPPPAPTTTTSPIIP